MLSALALPLYSIGAPSKPNIIVIMCDDLGYENVSFNLYDRSSSEVSTPNIDRIANEGVKFTAAYTPYSVSSPSRAGFMTGRYGQRFGYERNPAYNYQDVEVGLPLDEMTIAESLSQIGYTTGIIGKWHLGAHVDNHPCNRGFDEFFGHLGGGHRYFVDDLFIEDSYSPRAVKNSYATYIMRNHTPIEPSDMSDKYLTYCFTNEAVDFISRHKDEPFFLFLSYNAPHGPLEAPDGTTANVKTDSKEVKAEVYRKMVDAVDVGIKDILSKIDELGIDEETIIFFLSDNGGDEKVGADNGVLRDGKSSVFEGGYRVPYAVRWKGSIEASQVYDNPVSSLDIFATVQAITASPISNELDGANLMPFITGERNGAPHSEIYIRKFDQGWYAVRDEKYKYVVTPDGDTLYDIVDNIREDEASAITNNKAAKIKSKMKKLIKNWESEMIDPIFR